VLLAGQASFGQAAPVEKKSVMLFPFATPGMPAGLQSEAVAQFARDLFSLISEGASANRAYSVIQFEPRIACIQRAIREEKCDEKEVLTAIDTDPAGSARAQKLAMLTGSQLALLGSVDNYTYKAGKSDPGQPATPGQTDISATLLLIDVNKGKELYRFVATGQGSMTEANELTVGTAATYDLAQKLLTDFNKATLEEATAATDTSTEAPQPIVVIETKKSHKGLLPAMVGAALLGLLIGGK